MVEDDPCQRIAICTIADMHFRVLGPLTVERDGLEGPFGSPKERSVLAHLLSRPNEVAPVETLVDGLWGHEPPPSADKTLQSYIARIRRNLGKDAALETRGRGYVLHVDPTDVDAFIFQRLAEAGRRRLAAGDPHAAAPLLVAALSLWRGSPYADIAATPFAYAERERLREVRQSAIEDRIEADLQLGAGTHLIPELEHLLVATPLRERLWSQLLRSLYRSGRQSEALAAYQRARTVLIDELGVEPGADLQATHAAVLAHADSVNVPVRYPAAAMTLVAPAEELPLVGRESATDALVDAWSEAVAGHGGGLWITGAHGAGKSRMLRELAGAASDAAVFTPRDDAVDIDPVAAIARRIFGTEVTDLLASHPGMTNAADVVGDYLVRVSEQQPALVLVDDGHVTASAGDSLRRLVNAVSSARVLIAVSAQTTATLPGLRRLDLPPLDVGGVQALATEVVGADDAEEAAAEVAPRSAGRPGVAIVLLRQWQERTARTHVQAAARAVASGRSDIRDDERTLTENVVRLSALRTRSAGRAVRHPEPAVCPYKGLARFETTDAEYFCGRERVIAEAVARMVGSGLLAVVGPSGSGKSSLVRAGLVPAVHDGVLPGSQHWTVAVLRPGEHPMSALADAVACDDPASVLTERVRGGLLLVVDQLEEVFTACRDADERSSFIAALLTAARAADGHAAVVVTLRADFYGRLAVYREFARLLSAGQMLVGPMDAAELRRAIEVPAERAGLTVEPALVHALVSDTVAEPGALPLLSTALLSLWQRRQAATLTLAAYESAGRVPGAIARVAEGVYAGLGPAEQHAARRILLRLADVGGAAGSASPVRRRVPLADLEPGREDVRTALDALTHQRLVTISHDSVEVAHEALLREWPRLHAWLEEDVEGRRLHQHLSQAAREWQEAGREATELYRGARLAATVDWAVEHGDEMNALENAFVDSSRGAADAEARAVRRSNRRLRTAVAGVAVLLVIAVVAAGVAAAQRGRAQAAANAADARRLGAQALLDTQLDRSLLLAVESVAAEDSPETRGALLASQQRNPQAVAVVRGDGDRLLDAETTPDGGTLVLSDNDGTVTFWDVDTPASQAEHVTVPGGVPIGAIVFDATGRRMATDGADGGVVIWDVATRTIESTITNLPDFPTAWAFQPDSAALLIGVETGEIVRWQKGTQRSAATDLRFPGGMPLGLAFSRDGRKMVATTDSTEPSATVVWDVRSATIIDRAPIGGSAVMTGDGDMVVIGTLDGRIVRWDLRTGAKREVSGRHDGGVMNLALSADERRLISTSDDRTVAVWDLETGDRVEVLEGHAGRTQGGGFGGDGQTVYSASLDGTGIAWDLSGRTRLDHARRPSAPIPHETLIVPSMSVAPDGTSVAVPRADGRIEIVPVDGTRPSRFIETSGPTYTATYAPDGTVLAAGGEPGAFLVELTADEPTAEVVDGVDGFVGASSISPDSAVVAFGGEASVSLYDRRRSRLVATLDVGAPVGALTFSPDGRRLAVGDGAGDVSVWDLETHREVARATLDDIEVWSVEYSPDGAVLAAGGVGGEVHVLDASTAEPVRTSLGGLAGWALRLSFSRDGTLLAASSTNGTVTLFDMETGRRHGTPLAGPPNRWIAGVFHPSRQSLVAMSDDGTRLRWDLEPSVLLRRACHVAGRTLSEREWDEAIPDRPYSPACVDGRLR